MTKEQRSRERLSSQKPHGLTILFRLAARPCDIGQRIAIRRNHLSRKGLELMPLTALCRVDRARTSRPLSIQARRMLRRLADNKDGVKPASRRHPIPFQQRALLGAARPIRTAGAVRAAITGAAWAWTTGSGRLATRRSGPRREPARPQKGHTRCHQQTSNDLHVRSPSSP